MIGELIDNLTAVLDTVNTRDEELAELVVALQELVSGLAEDREPIGDAIVAVGELTEVTAGFLDEARPPLHDDIVLLGDLAENLDENEETVERFLQNWPGKLNTISRAASYGSWFQFYLCGCDRRDRARRPRSRLPQLEVYKNPAKRCGPDPDGDGELVGG